MAKNKDLKVSITPEVAKEKLEAATTLVATTFKKKMEGVGKVFGKMGAGAKAMGRAGHKALTGMQSGLAILDAYLAKLGEIRGIAEQLTGKFGDDLDFANSLGTSVENLQQLYLAYANLGVGEDLVRTSLEKFQQLVASDNIEVTHGDQLQGYMEFLDRLQAMNETERNAWLTQLGGKNLTGNRKIMDANSALQGELRNVKANHGDLILAYGRAGLSMDEAGNEIARLNFIHDMESLIQYERMGAGGASGDMVRSEKSQLELKRLQLEGYDGSESSLTSMKAAADQEKIISGAGVALGNSFFAIVKELMSAEYKSGASGFFARSEQFFDNVGVALGAVVDGLKPLQKFAEMVGDTFQGYANNEAKANADANHGSEF